MKTFLFFAALLGITALSMPTFTAAAATVNGTTAGNWTFIQKDFAVFALGISFQTALEGWVLGATGAVQPLADYTTDGGTTFTNKGISGVSNGAFLSLGMSSSKVGVAGGFGFFGLPCGAYAKDGEWYKANEGRAIVCVSPTSLAPSDGSLIQVGFWAEIIGGGSGYQVSTDGGKKFEEHSWPAGLILGEAPEASYGSFQDKDNGYLSGGVVPQTSNIMMETKAALRNGGRKPEDSFSINSLWRWDGETQTIRYQGPYSERLEDPEAELRPIDSVEQYAALVMKTSGGSWTTVYNTTGDGKQGGSISCISNDICYLIVFGATSSLLKTTNGGSSWDTLLEGPVAFTTVETYGSNTVWLGGATSEGSAFFLQSSDAGATFQASNTIRAFAPFSFSIVDETTAFVSGISSVGLSSILGYSVNSQDQSSADIPIVAVQN